MSSWPAKVFLMLLLTASLAVLTKYILFKKYGWHYKEYLQTSFSLNKAKAGLRKANLKPFATIQLMQSHNLTTTYKVENIAGNIAGFLPLGFLFPMLFAGMRRAWKTILLVFLFSLAFETIQLFTGLGVFDVDDLILNTTGGLVGYLFYVAAYLLSGRKI